MACSSAGWPPTPPPPRSPRRSPPGPRRPGSLPPSPQRPRSPAPKKVHRQKSTVKSAKSTKRPVRRRSTTARRRVRRPAGQAKPSPERYAEIQRALKQRGYFEGETDGKWGEASTLALKKFQQEQNLKPDGKLGSLSLIALGLGPKRGSVQPAPSAPQSAPTPTPPVAVPTEGSPPTPNDKAPQ
ncbi:MAG: peptidoglycan-binding protein [Bryobacterales bacterium]|nr:peptidoglycan-binding protein [Bryobacterales bacterium]